MVTFRGARFIRYGDFAVDGDAGVGSELPTVDQLKRVFEAAGVSDTSRVVIYGSGAPVAAARAFFTLDAAGHPRVALLDGGLAAWRAEKRPLETGAGATVTRGTFTPRINAARVADAAFIQQKMSGSAMALARHPARSRIPRHRRRHGWHARARPHRRRAADAVEYARRHRTAASCPAWSSRQSSRRRA